MLSQLRFFQLQFCQLSFKMDESVEQSKAELTLQEIARAQKSLDDIEGRMKKFRSKKKEDLIDRPATAYPDLNKYFSYLNEPQLTQEIQFAESQCLHNSSQVRSSHKVKNVLATFDKENDSLTINQKLEKEKKSSIIRLEEYFIERTQVLDDKMAELRQQKERILRAQKVLVRNNEELQLEIESRRRQKVENSSGSKLQLEVRRMRNKLCDLQEENRKIGVRRNEFERQLKANLKGQKQNLRQDIQVRTKSTSHGKCEFH